YPLNPANPAVTAPGNAETIAIHIQVTAFRGSPNICPIRFASRWSFWILRYDALSDQSIKMAKNAMRKDDRGDFPFQKDAARATGTITHQGRKVCPIRAPTRMAIKRIISKG